MDRLKKLIRNYKWWVAVSTLSLVFNVALGLAVIHYRDVANSEINTITVSWHKSNEAFRPHVTFPGVCYEKEVTVNGEHKQNGTDTQ